MNRKQEQIAFGRQDLATALIRQSQLHEGYWRVYLQFGPIAAVNANHNGHVYPSVFVPVVRVGLMRDAVLTDLSVDAAEVNPRVARAPVSIH